MTSPELLQGGWGAGGGGTEESSAKARVGEDLVPIQNQREAGLGGGRSRASSFSRSLRRHLPLWRHRHRLGTGLAPRLRFAAGGPRTPLGPGAGQTLRALATSRGDLSAREGAAVSPLCTPAAFLLRNWGSLLLTALSTRLQSSHSPNHTHTHTHPFSWPRGTRETTASFLKSGIKVGTKFSWAPRG